MICCLSSGDVYLFFGASISSCCNSLECNFIERNSTECNSVGDFLETLVILSAILLPIKSPVASAVFYITPFEEVFVASVVHF